MTQCDFGKFGSSVAPHVGAWIEIALYTVTTSLDNVAPHVGAWIEMSLSTHEYIGKPSPLT